MHSSTPSNFLSTLRFHNAKPSTIVPFCFVKYMVSCSIQCLHWELDTPTLFPHSTATGPKGWLGDIFTTNSIATSSTEYTATTSLAAGLLLIDMLVKVLEELETWSISRLQRIGEAKAVVNFSVIIELFLSKLLLHHERITAGMHSNAIKYK